MTYRDYDNNGMSILSLANDRTYWAGAHNFHIMFSSLELYSLVVYAVYLDRSSAALAALVHSTTSIGYGKLSNSANA
jgi:hypothetical protein